MPAQPLAIRARQYVPHSHPTAFLLLSVSVWCNWKCPGISMPDEIEIKFMVADIPALEERLRILGFHLQTPSTHELNTLFDTARGALRKSGQLLRLRRYGSTWTLTHKARGRK